MRVRGPKQQTWSLELERVVWFTWLMHTCVVAGIDGCCAVGTLVPTTFRAMDDQSMLGGAVVGARQCG